MTGRDESLESLIGRLLTIGTYASVALIAVGIVLMALNGRSPLEAAPGLDLGRITADIVALQPAGFLWLGLLLVLATPSARVAAAFVGYVRGGERDMAVVAILILAVIALGVTTGMLEG